MTENGDATESQEQATQGNDYEDSVDGAGTANAAPEPEEPEALRKIFIGGLTLTTSDEMLRDFFQQWGELVDYVVMKDSLTRRSRGFGFVTFTHSYMVDEAMNHRPHRIDGKSVDSKRAVPKEDSTKPETQMSVKRLYVSGIKDEHTDEGLREYFSQFGDVTEVTLITDNSGSKRGFAFVSFEDHDSVDKAVLMRSHMVQGKRCDVKKALSKDEMQKMNQHARERANRENRRRGPPGGWGDGGGGGGGRGGGRSGAGGGRGSWYGGGGGGGYGGGGGGYSGGGYGGDWGPPQGFGGGYGGPGGYGPGPQGGGYGGGYQQGWGGSGWGPGGGGGWGGGGAQGWNQAPGSWNNYNAGGGTGGQGYGYGGGGGAWA